VFIDGHGYVWEWELGTPHPVRTHTKFPFTPLEPVPAPAVDELDLTDADRQLLADLKVTA
jgi:hypothetical protein